MEYFTIVCTCDPITELRSITRLCSPRSSLFVCTFKFQRLNTRILKNSSIFSCVNWKKPHVVYIFKWDIAMLAIYMEMNFNGMKYILGYLVAWICASTFWSWLMSNSSQGKSVFVSFFWATNYIVRIVVHFQLMHLITKMLSFFSSDNYSFSIIGRFNRLPLYQLSMQCIYAFPFRLINVSPMFRINWPFSAIYKRLQRVSKPF